MGKKPAPLSLLPSNNHYLLFRDKPFLLVTSSEHYGALLNTGFDYIRYFNELVECGNNATRMFSGYYHEIPGIFSIQKNTLAPEKDAFICPWTRTSVPGAGDGGNKYDLDKFDDAYFDRLYKICKAASERGIVIEFTLFCVFYPQEHDGGLWEIAPFHHANNVNGIERVGIADAYSMNNRILISYQKKFVKKIVAFLNEFDNIYYEICNEPYFDANTLEWQNHIAKIIKETEYSLPNKHLIGVNVTNGYEAIQKPNEDISIFSFHYSNGDCMKANAGLHKVVGCNETGFAGMEETYYRRQAWELFMSGCAAYIGLDYSFAAGYEDGSFIGKDQPGVSSKTFRKQLGAMKDFLVEADVFNMTPDNGFIAKCFFGNGFFRGMSDHDGGYAIYAVGASWFELNLQNGLYDVEWLNPISLMKVDTCVECSQNSIKIVPPQSVLGDGSVSTELAVRLKLRHTKSSPN